MHQVVSFLGKLLHLGLKVQPLVLLVVNMITVSIMVKLVMAMVQVMIMELVIQLVQISVVILVMITVNITQGKQLLVELQLGLVTVKELPIMEPLVMEVSAINVLFLIVIINLSFLMYFNYVKNIKKSIFCSTTATTA